MLLEAGNVLLIWVVLVVADRGPLNVDDLTLEVLCVLVQYLLDKFFADSAL